MGLLDFIAGIFKPAVDIVDKVHTSEAEKLELRNALAKIEADMSEKYMELQGQYLEAQSKLSESAAKIAVAEASSESWLTRNYRPIIITSMFAMIMLESFGLLKTELPEIFWQIFAAAFGVMSVAPAALGKAADMVKSVFTKK